ncbi:hypothetical protein AAH979_21545 [Plantactinospora sp. ZYX-F-223]|uniref:hypothetical protein n=1 Tax=Plantactinospora sp. ZYX-F-223 TaxID=3144103 RepID=UPI0031FD8906
MSLYLSAGARKELRAAQMQLDQHTPSSAEGICPACGEPGPCALRRAALRVFGRYGCLPRRWPGASRPELINDASSWSGWLSSGRDGVSGV